MGRKKSDKGVDKVTLVIRSIIALSILIVVLAFMVSAEECWVWQNPSHAKQPSVTYDCEDDKIKSITTKDTTAEETWDYSGTDDYGDYYENKNGFNIYADGQEKGKPTDKMENNLFIDNDWFTNSDVESNVFLLKEGKFIPEDDLIEEKTDDTVIGTREDGSTTITKKIETQPTSNSAAEVNGDNVIVDKDASSISEVFEAAGFGASNYADRKLWYQSTYGEAYSGTAEQNKKMLDDLKDGKEELKVKGKNQIESTQGTDLELKNLGGESGLLTGSQNKKTTRLRGLFVGSEDNLAYASEKEAKAGVNPLGKCTEEKCIMNFGNTDSNDDVTVEDNGVVKDSSGNEIGKSFGRSGSAYTYRTTEKYYDKKGKERTQNTGRVKVFPGDEGSGGITRVEYLSGNKKDDDKSNDKESVKYFFGNDKEGKSLKDMDKKCKGDFNVDYSSGSYNCDGWKIYSNGNQMMTSGFINKDYIFKDKSGTQTIYEKCATKGGAYFCEDPKDDDKILSCVNGICSEMTDDQKKQAFSDGLFGSFGMFHFGSSLNQWVGLTSNKYSGLASLFYEDDMEDDFLGLGEMEFLGTVLGGMDSWTSAACEAGVEGGTSSGMAFSFGSGQSYAHIEAEKIIFLNISDNGTSTDQYLYKVSFEVDPSDCDMRFMVTIDGIPLFTPGWDLEEDDSAISYAGVNTYYDWSEKNYGQVCIEFDYIKSNCLAGVNSGGEVCNKIVDGVKSGDYSYVEQVSGAAESGETDSGSGGDGSPQQNDI